MWLAIVITIFGIVAYYRTQINKKTDNVNNMESIYLEKKTQLSTINDSSIYQFYR